MEEATNTLSWFYECARCLFFDSLICSTVLEYTSRESGSKPHGDATESAILFFPLSAGTYFLLVAGSLCFSHDEFFESVYSLKVK